MSRIVVIGAGIGGMATAARLSVKGHQVTIVEQSDQVGGKAGAYSRDGFVFDTGPSLITLPAVYRDLFLKTGTSLEDNVDLQPVEPGTSYRWSDGTRVTLPGVNPAAAATALGDALGGTAREDWLALIARAAEIWRITRKPFLESPLTGTRELLALAKSPRDVRTVAPTTSLRGLGRKYLRDPRLRMLLDRYATYSGSDPRKAPAALSTIPYVEQTFGSWHIGGGVHKLADALAARCEERKVDILLNSDVTRIVLDEGKVRSVELSDGSHLEADIVVSNADASHLYGDLVSGNRADAALRQLRKATPSFSGFVMLLAIKGRTPDISHHNVWFPADYNAEFDAVFKGRPATDPTIYACVPDDPLMRPDADHESWFVLINAPRHGHGKNEFDWSQTDFANNYADRMVELLAERGTDLRNRILWRELITPADLEARTRAPGGSIYGTSSNGMRAAFLRPANTSPIEGLYLVGGSSHPGGGLPLVGMSAEIVAETIGRARKRN
ncbi:MAG: phytoene desaturase family protein [Candidatus Nanopelagicales bacterium]